MYQQWSSIKQTALRLGRLGRVVKRLAAATRGLELSSGHLTLAARKDAFTSIRRELREANEWLTWAAQTVDFLEVDGTTDAGFKTPKEPSHMLY